MTAMTDKTKPTIDQQIAHLREMLAYGDLVTLSAAITSLERLKSLDAQPVPVEPSKFYLDGGVFVLAGEYDSLQSALKLAQEERDNEKEVRNCISRAHEAEQKRAEKAEALAEQNRKAIDQAARVMRGEGVNDQGEAWDKCLQILDAAIDSARAE